MTRLDRELLADLDAGLLDPIEAVHIRLAAEAEHRGKTSKNT